MASAGQVPRGDVWDMLNKCASGWSHKETDHLYKITWRDRTYQSFPKHPKIDSGHVKKMCRHLGILDCAKEEIEQLR